MIPSTNFSGIAQVAEAAYVKVGDLLDQDDASKADLEGLLRYCKDIQGTLRRTRRSIKAELKSRGR